MALQPRRLAIFPVALLLLLIAEHARAANLRASGSTLTTNSEGVITEGVDPDVFTTYDLAGESSTILNTTIDKLDLRTWIIKMNSEQFQSATPISHAHRTWNASLSDGIVSIATADETVGIANMEHHFKPKVFTKERVVLFSERTTAICDGFAPCDFQVTFDSRLDATSDGRTRFTFFIGVYIYNRLEVPLAWLQFMEPILQLHVTEETVGFGDVIKFYAKQRR